MRSQIVQVHGFEERNFMKGGKNKLEVVWCCGGKNARRRSETPTAALTDNECMLNMKLSGLCIYQQSCLFRGCTSHAQYNG